ncbi:hypothetical protein H9N28_08105 [Rhodobacter capsulatus]|uniref:BRO-N domain-containing protein n=1 Tax=Rhodobacter capsulatus TaxID=1061 RepID=UPI0006DC62CD|nr:BRO family protein [Rhodobacter capsulatus]KQB13207.1 hypothetical protein AP071_17205 [Rhodobacter capsulatus]KQB15700.1 hypothetical protein AP073_13695 [Rhodobacter capsulatus]PZX21326.1 prophage antirepressor-like protein [Rhodobacter capsulatus]QNR64759.1 hypothetical protein H9N28_08105 [Rhodobacter capsulatus]
MNPINPIVLPGKSFDLNTFTFNDVTLRTVLIDGNPWFALIDVLALVGIAPTNAYNYTRRYMDASEWTRAGKREFNGGTYFNLKGVLDPSSVGGSITLVSESGLYKTILRAQRSNPAAKEVQDWVTKEVLPRIRRDGAYIMGEEKVATGEISEDDLLESMAAAPMRDMPQRVINSKVYDVN